MASAVLNLAGDRNEIQRPSIPQGATFIPCTLDTSTLLDRKGNQNPKYRAELGDRQSTILPWELCFTDKTRGTRFSPNTVYVLTTLNKGFSANMPDWMIAMELELVGVASGTASMDKRYPTDVSVLTNGKVTIINSGKVINAGDKVMWSLPDPDEVAKRPHEKHGLTIEPYRPFEHNILPHTLLQVFMTLPQMTTSSYNRHKNFPLVDGAMEILQGLESMLVTSVHILGLCGLLPPRWDIAPDEMNNNSVAYRKRLTTNETRLLEIFEFLGSEFGAIQPIRATMDPTGLDSYNRVTKKAKTSRRQIIGPSGSNETLETILIKVISGVEDYLPYPRAKKPNGEPLNQQNNINNTTRQILECIVKGVARANLYNEHRFIGTALNTAGPEQDVHVNLKHW